MSTIAQPPKPKRRWYPFSLLTLLVVMTVATVAFGGWVQYMRQRARENRDRVAAVEAAVAAIEKLGGEVVSEYTKLRSQTWLEEQFDDPGGVHDPVGVLKVERVNLVDTEVTDAGLEHLKGLKSLLILYLGSTEVTDAGLEHLKGLTSLKELWLINTDITDEGVEKLQQALPNCKMTKTLSAQR